MSRTSSTNPLKKVILAIVAVGVVAGGTATAIVANSSSHKVAVSTNSQHQTTYISYHGVAGQDALTLLKKHATVSVKHYSFGDLVTSINGSQGNGPKYWTFYVNGKEAQVGAGSYKSKASDILSWKLQ